MKSLAARNLNLGILEQFWKKMPVFTIFGHKMKIFSLKIASNWKYTSGIWSKTEMITNIYPERYISILSGSTLLFSVLCQTGQIERLKISSFDDFQTMMCLTISYIKTATNLFMRFSSDFRAFRIISYKYIFPLEMIVKKTASEI